MTCTLFSIRRRTSILALTAVIALLTACGQKGPLTLPGKEGSDTRQPPTNAQDADADQQVPPAGDAPAVTTAPATTTETTAPEATE